MIYFLLFVDIIILLIIIILAVFHRRGRLKYSDTYSYMEVFSISLIGIFLASFFSILVFIISKSFEGAITVFVIAILIILVATIQHLLYQYQIKRRGGKKR